MPGSGPNVGFDPYPTQLSDYAVPVLVYRFDRSRAPGDRYRPIPNVYCRGIQRPEGAEPSVARFEYVFDDTDPTSPIPSQFDQVWPLGASGPYVVESDMEIVVLGIASTGAARPLFHGHAQVPQADVQPAGQSVTFVALGVEARAWDNPIGGRIERNADDPNSTADADQVATALPVRFNPANDQGGVRANCTPDGQDVGTGVEDKYPVFLDPYLQRDPAAGQTYWTAGKAVRYVLGVYNPQVGDFILWVKNPDFTNIDAVLKAKTPSEGTEFYDPGDPGTYDSHDIIIRDYSATNRAWPEVVADLAGFAGAVVRFDLSMDEDGEPVTTLHCRRGDATTVPTRDVYLQPMYETLDPSRTNVQDLHVARDAIHLANAFEIETDPIGYEVSVVLAAGFTPVIADASNLTDYLLSNLRTSGATATKRRKYREYVADEAGDGHYDGTAFVDGVDVALDLDAVFGTPDDNGQPQYCRRLRKPERSLFSTDASGRRLKATLAVSRDYAGAHPAVWDGTGHWQPVEGGWELMPDRMGIRVVIDDPEQWDIGRYAGANPQNPSRNLRGITSQANPSGTEQNTKQFYLRLTCVVESDQMLEAVAGKRAASPTEFTRLRRIDCKDHFRREVIHKSSQFFDPAMDVDGTGLVVSRDDSLKAEAHAESLRAAQEFPPLNGSVTIPWLANGYSIGDRIRSIAGRDISLQSNAGTQGEEAPRYPYVVGIDWDFSGEAQRTTLHYSDRRLEPQRQ